MGYETVRGRIAARMIVFAAVLMFSAGIALAQQTTVSGAITGHCISGCFVTVTLYDAANGLMYQKNATVTVMIPKVVSRYNATFYGIATSTLFNVSVAASGSPPCLARGDGESSFTSPATDLLPPVDTTLDISLMYEFNPVTPENGSTYNNDTYFEWNFTYEYPVVFRLLVDNNPDFSSPEVNRSGIAGDSYTLNSTEELEDGAYSWRVDAFNLSNGAFIQSSGVTNFSVNNGAVTLSNPSPSSTDWFNTTSVLFSVQTDGNATCRYSISPGTDYSAKTPMTSTGGLLHSATVPLVAEGGNNIYAQCNSSLGMLSAELMHTIQRDTGDPGSDGFVVINDGDIYSLTTTLNVSWGNFTDPVSGIAGYYYGYSRAGRIYTTHTSAVLPGAQQGNERVYVWAVDRAGNIGLSTGDSIIVDTLPPAITLESITNINKYSDDDLEVVLRVQDSSSLNGTYPKIRYQKWNSSVSQWENMTGLGSSRYSFTVHQAPDQWINHVEENITLWIFAQDIHGRVSTMNITELINNASTPPVVGSLGPYSVNQDETISFNISVEDPDKDNVVFRVNNTDASVAQINRSLGRFTWTPSAGYVGTVDFTISIDDGIYVVNRTVRIIVIDVNDDPVFAADNKAELSAYVYQVFNATFNATDADNDDLEFSTNSSLWPISTRTGEIRAYPTDDARGLHHVNITVADGRGGYDYFLARITVLYCGDKTCSTDYEGCSSCEQDCGACGETESAAIIIYPRNCLEETMTIKAVRLVERATCDTKGLIVDGMEVCGNLSDQEIYLEMVINNTYEEVATLITDENGIVTFTPVEQGQYRITMKSYDIETTFTAKECVEDNENSTVTADVATASGTVSKEVERPEEVIIPPQEKPRLFYFIVYIVIPFLALVLLAVLARFYYEFEVRRMRQGKKDRSAYVDLMDRFVLSYYFRARKWIAERILRSDYVLLIVKYAEDIAGRFRRGKSGGKGLSLYSRLARMGILPKPRPKLFDVKYFDVPDLDDRKRKELVGISVARFLIDKIRTKTIIKGISDALQGSGKVEMPDLAYAFAASGLKVEYRDQKAYAKGDAMVPKIARCMSAGVKFKKMAYTLDDIKRLMKKRAMAVIEIRARNSKGEVVRSVLPVIGYDKRNIIVHDYFEGIKERKIKAELLARAWKNAYRRVIIVER